MSTEEDTIEDMFKPLMDEYEQFRFEPADTRTIASVIQISTDFMSGLKNSGKISDFNTTVYIEDISLIGEFEFVLPNTSEKSKFTITVGGERNE